MCAPPFCRGCRGGHYLQRCRTYKHAGRMISIQVIFLILISDKGKHILKSVHFWKDWGRIMDEGYESYPAIIPQILPQILLRLWALHSAVRNLLYHNHIVVCPQWREHSHAVPPSAMDAREGIFCRGAALTNMQVG